MSSQATTFGEVVARRRRDVFMSQRDLAAQLKREDGQSISAAYLNDIEHDRRMPSPDLVREFARVLKLEEEHLAYLAGRFPLDEKLRGLPQEKFEEVLKAFRKAAGP